MASWIKWTRGLPDKPEVVRLAGLLGLPREVVVCKLMRFWEWCDDCIPNDSISENGSAFVTLSPSAGDNAAFVDALVGTPKFADSLALVGWIKFRDGRVELPNFGRHNLETAKTRARNAMNQKRKRGSSGASGPPPPPAGVTEPSPRMSPPRGDKTVTRGEESISLPSEEGGSDDPPPRASKSTARKPAEQKPRQQADTPFHRAVGVYCRLWAERYGERCTFGGDGGRKGKAVKDILAELGGDVERFAEVAGRYFADGNKFLTDERHPPGVLLSDLDKWKVAGPKPAAAPAQKQVTYFDAATCPTI